jgi:hypothetical protein
MLSSSFPEGLLPEFLQRALLTVHRIGVRSWNARDIFFSLWTFSLIPVVHVPDLSAWICSDDPEVSARAHTFVSNAGRDHHDISCENLKHRSVPPSELHRRGSEAIRIQAWGGQCEDFSSMLTLKNTANDTMNVYTELRGTPNTRVTMAVAAPERSVATAVKGPPFFQ